MADAEGLLVSERLRLLERLAAAQADPKLLNLIEPGLKFAKVKLTDNCNSRCITCDYWKQRYANELTAEEIATVLGELHALGVEEVMFTGGEPTLRPELPDLVGVCASSKFPTIGVTTNGLSLGNDKLRQLIANGLNEIVLSLEGLRTHDEIRGVPGNARKVLNVLTSLSELRRSAGKKISVKVATTLMERTLDEVRAVVELAAEHDAVFFLNLIDRGTYFFRGAAEDLFAIKNRRKLDGLIDALIAIKAQEPDLIGNTISSLEYARRYFDDPRQDQVPCHLGYVGIDIDANGDIYSNCWGLPPIGNVRKQRLVDVVQSKAYASRCQSMYKKLCPGCSCGYILNLAYHWASVEQDLRHGLGTAVWSIGYAGSKALG